MNFTLVTPAQATLKIQRSEFIAFLYPVESAPQIQELLKQHNQEYANATHNCYAWILGLKQETRYYADAGEPGGTAGKPILNALLRHDLTNVLAIVTRYFGGIKLGVKGLIDAYGAACEAAIEVAEVIPAVCYHAFHIDCEYSLQQTLKHQLDSLNGILEDILYESRITMKVQIPEQVAENFRELLAGLSQSGKLSYKDDKK